MKLYRTCGMGILSLALAGIFVGTGIEGSVLFAQTGSSSSSGQMADGTQAAQVPLERLVTMTCRQAWQMSGRNEEAFFGFVKQLTELAAHNRDVTLPDDKAAGGRAGQWIRTQAIKDPDQLLYAVVDHAVQYSIAKGRTTPASNTSVTPSNSQ